MEAYKEVVEELANNIDLVTLRSINALDEYNLNCVYHVTGHNVAYLFDRFADKLFIEKIEVDLRIWFESKKPWSLALGKEQIHYLDVLKVKEAS